MKNKFTRIICLLLSFSCFTANAQFNLAVTAASLKDEIPAVEAGTIRGNVLTTDNKPAIEVNITLKHLNQNTLTDENGNFVFRNVKTGNHVVAISMVGLQALEKEITVSTGQTVELSYTLIQTSRQLEEVIVTARRTMNEKNGYGR
jgi:iron complex outermembrane receptor protein